MPSILNLLLALSLLPAGVPGRYAACWLGGIICSATIDIRADGSFAISLEDEPPMEGRWKMLDNGLLLANTLEQAAQAPMNVESRGSSGYVTICATDDTTGRPISHVDVFVDAGYFSYSDLTNSRGCVRVLRAIAQGFSTSHDLFESTHHDLPGKTATRVRVRLIRKRPHITNEQWFLSEGKLYRLSGEPLTRVPQRSEPDA